MRFRGGRKERTEHEVSDRIRREARAVSVPREDAAPGRDLSAGAEPGDNRALHLPDTITVETVLLC